MFGPVVVNARFLTQPITGTQRFAIELCRGIKQLQPTITLLAPDNIIHKDIAEELDVKVIGKLRKGILWEQFELPLILRQNGSPILLNLCNLAPIAYSNNIVSVLDLSFKLHPEWFSKQFSLLYNFFVPKVVANAKRIITISESSKNDISKYYNVPASQIDIIYPSVSRNFSESSLKPEKFSKYGDYILAVSSIDPRKNFKGLIQAFKAGNFGNTRLVIVGSEHKVFANNDLKQLVANDSRIVFTGYIDDNELIELYQNACVFAYPSYFEGFGIPPLEAMACGCPTLVSNTTSLPEVCGDASIYVDPYDINSITEGLSKILSDKNLSNTLVKRGYERLSKFSWHQSSIKLISIIDSLNAH
ncbi:glycosyltransferase family 4 protein [uncultured Fibrella sp.]|uniref:glycosyltransferase family 4 protein n=1 Tax=uncultured Fibrella sp. TaxID=1284596 RepID=UPI0035CB63A0